MRRRHVAVIGWLGVSIDVILIVAYPFITRAILASQGLHWAYALKGLMPIIFIILIAINGLALRPVYPTAVGIAATTVFASMYVIARGDPSISWGDAPGSMPSATLSLPCRTK